MDRRRYRGYRVMKRFGRLIILAMSTALLALAAPASLRASEGFDYTKHSIPVSEIESGGPGKDAIPSLVNPVFVSAAEAAFLGGSDKVLGVAIGDKAKAYPIKILNWHEAVNDTLDGMPIMATW